MKKLLKQLLAVTTAIMMAITLLPAMANAEATINPNDTNTGTLTLTKKVPKKNENDENEVQDPVKGAVFTAYKVAKLTPGENGFYSKFELVDPFKTLNLTSDTLGNISTKELENQAKVARDIAEKGNFTEQVNKWTSGLTGEDGVTTISNLPKGYYLVVETTTPNNYVASAPFFISVPMTNNNGDGWTYKINAMPKNEKIPGTEKTADEETVGTNQVVTYTVKGAQVAKYDLDAYTEEDLKYWITDTLPEGLTFNDDIRVYNNVTKDDNGKYNFSDADLLVLGTDYTMATKGEKDTYTFKVELNGAQVTKQEGKSIYVVYSATATDPTIGNTGNTNSASTDYTNNPNGGVYTSPKTNTVYSFEIKVEKTGDEKDEKNENKKLAGAEFELLDGTDTIWGKGTSGKDGLVTFYAVDVDGNVIEEDGEKQELKLPEGEYYLKETKAPSGYSLLNSKVKVEISKKADSTGYNYEYKINNEKENKSIGENGIVTVPIENKKGFTLPGTGGMGTYIFTIGGLVVMAGAVLLLVSSKKKRA